MKPRRTSATSMPSVSRVISMPNSVPSRFSKVISRNTHSVTTDMRVLRTGSLHEKSVTASSSSLRMFARRGKRLWHEGELRCALTKHHGGFRCHRLQRRDRSDLRMAHYLLASVDAWCLIRRIAPLDSDARVGRKVGHPRRPKTRKLQTDVSRCHGRSSCAWRRCSAYCCSHGGRRTRPRPFFRMNTPTCRIF